MSKNILKMGTETLPINSVFVACLNFLYWEKEGKFGELTRGNWHTTVREMAAETGIRHHVVQEMVESLRQQKIFSCRVPHSLTEERKIQPKNISSQLMELNAIKGFAPWWQVTEAGIITLSWKQNYKPWNGIAQEQEAKKNALRP